MGGVKERSQVLRGGAQGESGRQRHKLERGKFCVSIRKTFSKGSRWVTQRVT